MAIKYYRHHHRSGAKIKRFIFRLLFVIVMAVIITVLAIILGNLLLKRLNTADEILETAPQPNVQEEDPENISADIIKNNYKSVFGVSILPSTYKSTDAIMNEIQILNPHYDTLGIHIINENGNLIYNSQALSAALHFPYIQEDKSVSELKNIVSTAKKNRMMPSAILRISENDIKNDSSYYFVGLLINELSQIGFNEVLLVPDGISEEKFADTQAEHITALLKGAKKLIKSNCKIGILFPADVYLGVSNAKYIQIISTYVSFMGISFQGGKVALDTYNATNEIISSLLGNFNVYNLRVVIDDTAPLLISAKYAACVDNNIKNIQFMTKILPDELTPVSDSPDTDSVETESGKESVPINPYATVKPSEDNVSQKSSTSWY